MYLVLQLMDLFCSDHVEINILKYLFQRLRSPLICLFIYGRHLFGLYDTKYSIEGDVIKLGPPLNMDRASPVDEILFTEQSVIAGHY